MRYVQHKQNSQSSDCHLPATTVSPTGDSTTRRHDNYRQQLHVN